MDNLPIFFRKRQHSIQYLAAFLPVRFFRRKGDLFQVSVPVPGGAKTIAAEIDGNPDQPGLAVLLAFKGGPALNELQENVLQHIFSICLIFQTGEGQPQNHAAVSVQKGVQRFIARQ